MSEQKAINWSFEDLDEEKPFSCDGKVTGAEWKHGEYGPQLVLTIDPTSYEGAPFPSFYSHGKAKKGKWGAFLKALQGLGIVPNSEVDLIGKEFHWETEELTFDDPQYNTSLLIPTEWLNEKAGKAKGGRPANIKDAPEGEAFVEEPADMLATVRSIAVHGFNITQIWDELKKGFPKIKLDPIVKAVEQIGKEDGWTYEGGVLKQG